MLRPAVRYLFVINAACWLPLSVAQTPAPLAEVVVTASLRLKTVEDLPASVSVIAADAVSNGAVQHLEELLPQIPSLSWAGASSRPRYFQLRGIGELEQYQGAPNPSVGFLVDEIDFSGIGMIASLFDVEQIEVLRGPQGTRYGANALGGLIKVKTRDPSLRRTTCTPKSAWARMACGRQGLRRAARCRRSPEWMAPGARLCTGLSAMVSGAIAFSVATTRMAATKRPRDSSSGCRQKAAGAPISA